MLCFVNIFNTRKRKHNFFFENVNISNILQFFKTSQKRKMFGVKVVPIDVINHPLQYGWKKLGHPVVLKHNLQLSQVKFVPICVPMIR